MKAHGLASGLTLGITSCLLHTTPSWADSGLDVLQEVVVTAQKREENIQNVPIAITAMSEDQLAASGVRSTDDLKNVVPGLSLVNVLSTYSQPRVRGIGTAASGPGVENSVATYVDGVYLASPSSTMMALTDIAQVAVLKGPQGTLFGRNATGGLIQITTKSPNQEFSGEGHLTYATQNTYGADLYLTGGVTDNLAANLSLLYSDQQKGYGINLFNGQDVNKAKTYALRSKWQWTPSDNTTVTLAADYSNTKAAGPAIRTFGLTETGGPMRGGDFDLDTDYQPAGKAKSSGASVTVKQDLNDLQLVSITAYRRASSEVSWDLDQTPIPILNAKIGQNEKQFSQELQLISNGDGDLKWMVGAYYFWSSGRYEPNVLSGPGLAIAFGIPGVGIVQKTTQGDKSYAAFGQATYAFNPETNLTVGLRYTSDLRSIDSSKVTAVGNITLFPLAPAASDEQRFSKVTWRLALDHRFSDEYLGYVSYDRGFKAGLYNPQALPLDVVEPEVLDAYQMGVKMDFADLRIRNNVGLYYYQYHNIQSFYVLNGSAFIVNAGDVHVYGIDDDFTMQFTPNFALTVGGSWLHGRYVNFPGALKTTPVAAPNPGAGANTLSLPKQGVGGPGIDATGNRLQHTPDWTVSLVPTYLVPTSIGNITLSATLYHNSGYYADAENRFKQDSYNTYDASALWTSNDEKWDVRLWGKNLSNEAVKAQPISTKEGDNSVVAPGRSIGITAGMKF